MLTKQFSLHQAHFNNGNIKFKRKHTHTLPPTCDSIIKNLINNPLHHLGLINQKNVTPLFKDSNNLSNIKLKKLGSQLTKDFSAEICQTTYPTQSNQLIDLLNEIENLSVAVDGFYIMQPIVVDQNNLTHRSRHTLLRGQQRVTNIYMILKYLESSSLRFNTCKSSTDLLNKHFLGTISFEAWDNFLNNLQVSDQNDYLSEVYQTLHNWFAKKSIVEQEIWKKKLLNHTKFIWYVTDNNLFESEKMQKRGGVGIEAKQLN